MPFGSEGTEQGIGLALSGGGFRATLFHLGTLWRLNELGYLPKLDRISSVSGGSITSGVLGLGWPRIAFDGQGVAGNFDALIVAPLREFCRRLVDAPAVGEGALLPWKRVSDAVREEYEEHLYGKATLQDLPDQPRFVFNATNLQTGKSFRFSKPYAGDYRLGLIRAPRFSIAQAVTASSAFPPVLSPVVLQADPGAFEAVPGADLHGQAAFTRTLYLTDGGVYDNMGLETVWGRYDTVLVSDAGAPLSLEEKVETAWHSQTLRALDVITDQARAVRKRMLIRAYQEGDRKGSYWGIRTDIRDYGLADNLPCSDAAREALAGMPTRLAPFSESDQCRLINWGYALCDAAMRRHVLDPTTTPAPTWPYPQHPLA